MSKITNIRAREILDSRGNPTIETRVTLEGGAEGIASVPSGASLGKYEAVSLYDNDPERYNGLGVLMAVKNVNEIIRAKLIGFDSENQLLIDETLITLDGTENKSKLGANAILSVSQGVCEAAAAVQKLANYQYLGQLFGLKNNLLKVPTPTFNLINGGSHGAGNLDFQEFHVIPNIQKSYSDALRMGQEIYQATKKVLIRHKAVHSVGDEGGFAPNLFSNLDALQILVEGIKETNYEFRRDVFFGLDVAAGSFYKEGRYQIRDRTVPLETADFIDFYRDLLNQYPLLNLEDPLSEDDWDGWVKISHEFPQTLIVGDDLLATNKKRVAEAIKRKACSAILIKPNQIGTISETLEVIRICRQAGWKVIVSHRSGETNDDFIADFSVGVGADFTKFGAPARGERVAKYNRLLEIESELRA